MHDAAAQGHDATVERLLAAGADVNAVTKYYNRGLGAGRADPDFCRNLSEFCFRTSTLPGFKHLFKLIEIAVGCGGKRNVKIVLVEATIELTLVFTWTHPS